MMRRPAAVFAILLLAAAPLLARGKWHEEFLKHWKVSKEFTLAVAGLMPADGYSSKPNPEEMTFGELMVHIGDANTRNFALIAGIQPPAKPAATGKATAMQYLAASFDFCLKAAEALSEEQLDQMTGPSKNMSARERMWAYFTHTAHHRGQAEVYLRVRNIKPPEYRF
ncbi:MAG: DinB family protein [Bryobacteraceae bacterium]